MKRGEGNENEEGGWNQQGEDGVEVKQQGVETLQSEQARESTERAGKRVDGYRGSITNGGGRRRVRNVVGTGGQGGQTSDEALEGETRKGDSVWRRERASLEVRRGLGSKRGRRCRGQAGTAQRSSRASNLDESPEGGRRTDSVWRREGGLEVHRGLELDEVTAA